MVDLIIVDSRDREGIFRDGHFRKTHYIQPKPNVFQGEHRLTPVDAWAASNARNSGICLCEQPTIAFCDDRCVLTPHWLDSIRESISGNYIVAGAYQKRIEMTVAGAGAILHGGTITGEDAREHYVNQHWGGKYPVDCPGEWLFGCTLALPLEWALAVNGYEELMDGLGAEDVVFGHMLKNNGYPMKYDARMKIVEDRTPSECGPVMFKTSKEKHPHDKTDKGHAAMRRFLPLKRTEHQWDLRAVRASVLRGEPWPIPTGPTHDWFDNQPLSEFK